MDVARVRRLAQMLGIGLSEGETQDLAGDLAAVIEQVDALDRVELASAAQDSAPEPGHAASEGPGLRPDEPSADPLTRPPESFAPRWRDGWFIVPRVR